MAAACVSLSHRQEQVKGLRSSHDRTDLLVTQSEGIEINKERGKHVTREAVQICL